MFKNKTVQALENQRQELRDLLSHLGQLLPSNGAKALELVLQHSPDLVGEAHLPQLAITIVVTDQYKIGLGPRIARFSRELVSSLPFLVGATIESLSTTYEMYPPDPDETNGSYDHLEEPDPDEWPRHVIVVAARYVGQLEECCAMFQGFLERVFGPTEETTQSQRSAFTKSVVSLHKLTRSERAELSYRIEARGGGQFSGGPPTSAP